MRRRWLLIFGCLALAGGTGRAHEGHGAIALAGGKVEGDRVTLTPRARAAIGLDTVDVAAVRFERTLVVPARVVVPAGARAAVASRVAGVVRRVHVAPGDAVAAGAPLAEVESPELAALAGEWAAAEAAARYAESEVVRVRPVAAGSVTLIDLLDLEAEARERRARASALAARFRRLADRAPADADGVPVGGVVLRAPRDGVVMHLDLVPGQGIAPETHLAEVADLAGAWIVGDVPEHRWREVAPGLAARLHLAGAAAPLPAVVDAVLPLAHGAHHVVEVRARLASDAAASAGLHHGLRGSLTIVTAVEERPTLPAHAVARSGMDRIVFLVEREGVYRRTRVAAAPPRGGHAEIRRGVYPGDTVVGHGAHQLAALFPPTSFKPDDAQLGDAGVALERVELRPVAEVLLVPGALAVPPNRRARAAPRLAGIVREVRVAEGDRVAAGERLFTVQSLAADALAMDLRLAAVRRDALAATVARLRPGAEGGATARRVLLARQAQLDRALAEVEGLRGHLAAAGVAAETLDAVETGALDSPVLVVTSPLGGVVSAVAASAGEVLAPSTPGVEVVDPARAWAEAVLHDRDLAALAGRDARGLLARVHPPAGAPVPGRVRALRPEVRGHERVVLALVELEAGDAALLPPPGVAVQVALELAPGAPALVIPTRAIRRRGTVAEVFVREPGGMARVPVTLGARDDRGVAVLAGLYPGDEVVVDGVEAVQTGILAVR